MPNNNITVADYIAQFLVEKNIKHVFGYQGGAITKMIDSIVATGKVEYIQNYHEQASAFCADSYSRVTHNIGVAMATSGPGATNLVTGIANTHLDSIPALFITGQDYTANATRNNGARLNGFQDLDIVTICKSITKYSLMITNPEDIKYELEKCYHIAKSGRPGAVLIDIPIDIQFTEIDPHSLKGYKPEAQSKNREYELEKTSIVTKLIKDAKRPLILAGGGIQTSQSSDLLKQFSQNTNIAVVSTLNGSDAVKGNYSFAGLHGNVYSNIIVKNADLIIALGARFGQRQVGKVAEKYSTAKIVHIDLDNSEFNRSVESELNIYAPINIFLEHANDVMAGEEYPQFEEWHNQMSEWRNKYRNSCEINTEGIKPVDISRRIINSLPENSIICSDVGQNQMWVAQAFEKRGRMRLLNSSGLGSMGYSVPAAIGAKYANPEAKIISCTGDGGLQMSLQELILIGHKQLDIKIIVYNNNALGMMREVMERYYNSNFHGANKEEFTCIDLKKAADTFGLDYIRLNTEENFDDIMPYLENDKPCIIDIALSINSKLSNRYDEEDIINENLING